MDNSARSKTILKYQNIFFYFILISFFFGCYYIITTFNIELPSILSVKYLFLSAIFLLLGFLTETFLFYLILIKSQLHVKFSYGVYVSCIAIFSKYIPGKIWNSFSRIFLLNNYLPVPLEKATIIITNLQIVELLSGIVVGSFCLFLFQNSQLNISALAMIIFFSISYYLNIFDKFILYAITKITKKQILPFHLSLKSKTILFIFSNLIWIFWSLGFYYLIKTFYFVSDLSIFAGFIFSFSAVVGIIAFITPGGIGIREGILVGLLTQYIFSFADATSLSVLSRLWFLCAELFLFCIGVLLRFFLYNSRKMLST